MADAVSLEGVRRRLDLEEESDGRASSIDELEHWLELDDLERAQPSGRHLPVRRRAPADPLPPEPVRGAVLRAKSAARAARRLVKAAPHRSSGTTAAAVSSGYQAWPLSAGRPPHREANMSVYGSATVTLSLDAILGAVQAPAGNNAAAQGRARPQSARAFHRPPALSTATANYYFDAARAPTATSKLQHVHDAARSRASAAAAVSRTDAMLTWARAAADSITHRQEEAAPGTTEEEEAQAQQQSHQEQPTAAEAGARAYRAWLGDVDGLSTAVHSYGWAGAAAPLAHRRSRFSRGSSGGGNIGGCSGSSSASGSEEEEEPLTTAQRPASAHARSQRSGNADADVGYGYENGGYAYGYADGGYGHEGAFSRAGGDGGGDGGAERVRRLREGALRRLAAGPAALDDPLRRSGGGRGGGGGNGGLDSNYPALLLNILDVPGARAPFSHEEGKVCHGEWCYQCRAWRKAVQFVSEPPPPPAPEPPPPPPPQEESVCPYCRSVSVHALWEACAPFAVPADLPGARASAGECLELLHAAFRPLRALFARCSRQVTSTAAGAHAYTLDAREWSLLVREAKLTSLLMAPARANVVFVAVQRSREITVQPPQPARAQPQSQPRAQPPQPRAKEAEARATGRRGEAGAVRGAPPARRASAVRSAASALGARDVGGRASGGGGGGGGGGRRRELDVVEFLEALVRLAFDYYNPRFREFGFRPPAAKATPADPVGAAAGSAAGAAAAARAAGGGGVTAAVTAAAPAGKRDAASRQGEPLVPLPEAIRRALDEHLLARTGGASAAALLAAPDDPPSAPPLHSAPAIADALQQNRRALRAAFLVCRRSEADKGESRALRTVSLKEWLDLLRATPAIRERPASAPVRAMVAAFQGAQQQDWLEARAVEEPDSVAQLDWPEFQEAVCLLAALAPSESAVAAAASASREADEAEAETGSAAANNANKGPTGEGTGRQPLGAPARPAQAAASGDGGAVSQSAEDARRAVHAERSGEGGDLSEEARGRRADSASGAGPVQQLVAFRLRELAAQLAQHEEVGLMVRQLATRAQAAAAPPVAGGPAASARRPSSALPSSRRK